VNHLFLTLFVLFFFATPHDFIHKHAVFLIVIINRNKDPHLQYNNLMEPKNLSVLMLLLFMVLVNVNELGCNKVAEVRKVLFIIEYLIILNFLN